MSKRKASEIDCDQVDLRASFATSASGDSSEGQGVYRQELDNSCDSAPLNITSRNEYHGSPEDDSNDPSGKKQRLVWSRQLHARFIECVKILGHNAVPTKILRLMNQPEVTREQVASHLQKYRLQLKKLAGLPPDAPLDNQTKDIMQATQNIFAASIPSAVLPSLVPSGMDFHHPQLVYSIPHGLTYLNGMGGMPQHMQAGIALQQPMLTTLGAGNMMALNMMPLAYNYNPYSVMLMPHGMYGAMGSMYSTESARGGYTRHEDEVEEDHEEDRH